MLVGEKTPQRVVDHDVGIERRDAVVDTQVRRVRLQRGVTHRADVALGLPCRRLVHAGD